MRKKTALRARSRPKMTRAIPDPGLIPKATPSPSARTKSTLENHSHRTPQLSRERIQSERAQRAINSSFVGFNDPLKVNTR